ncbi:LuxR family transcriptional regulator [Ramlibacter sp. G-1-2-2]|uniref:LuxR family transcriptional regulator n=1 Tax=Ramlibacter agri TaxID=2728837 RepID=A0A848H9L8_9BURK|nr:LuxR C-terminal-related transcriptional regulator [Ramlibacter agri]NML47184.1 LuxR family transcriptional regulator [Ramlibacter agri]
MQLIPVTHQAAVAGERAVEAFAGVVGCIGDAGFAQGALAQLNRWLPVSWWSVFRLHDDAPPDMPASGSYRAPDHTAESWHEYRTSLYRSDQTFLAAREQVQDQRQVLVHWHAHEIPRQHRERIYTRHGLRERLSIVCRARDEGLLAVNLYRHEELPRFSDEEIDLVGSAAGLLLSCVQRHLSLCGGAPTADTVLAGLTRRERDVCERMLKGWTYDGIAADLGVSPGTVKTYRDRAFDRLGIHHRNELFALASGRRA